MRKLASIRKIDFLEPIQGRDLIELAHIGGWKVIVKKQEFKNGDLCIYVEIDSILPEKPEFEFLRKTCYKPSYNGFRIKTLKMAGVISQGIIFPLSILGNTKIEEGQDVTEKLGIKKYDPEISKENSIVSKNRKHSFIIEYLLSFIWFRRIYRFFVSKSSGNFPYFLIKTDEERIQNYGEQYEKHRKEYFYATEKLDGCSVSYAVKDRDNFKFLKRKEFFVCSRNLRLAHSDNSHYWKVARKYNIQEKLETMGKNIAIQGEIVGPGIQENQYKLHDHQFYIYNVYDIDKGRFYSLEQMELFCDAYDFTMVPIISIGELDKSVDELIQMADGFSLLKRDILREGIVFRTIDYDVNKFSFKVVSNRFLLKNQKNSEI